MEDTEFMFSADVGNCEWRFGRVENRGGDSWDWADGLWFMSVTGVPTAAVFELLDSRMCPDRRVSVGMCRDVSGKDEVAE